MSTTSLADAINLEDNIPYLLPSVKLPLTESVFYASPVPTLSNDNNLAETKEPWVIGVDEAGRGPCLGPMVYAVSYCPLSKHNLFREHGFDDSKKLTEEKRTKLAKFIEENKDWIGWAVYVLSPQDISSNMFKKPPYNLNEQAHDATIKLIRHVFQSGVNVESIFVDPVGPTKSYQSKLESHFPNTKITVENKADAIYPIVSAASICAKVTRDQYLQNWHWTEPGLADLSKKFGSGYPSDPNTKAWLREHQDPFFGFPSITRFSWGTIKELMKKENLVNWEGDEDDNKGNNGSEPLTKKAKKLLEEKMAKKERKRQQQAKYSHHERGEAYKRLRLERSDSLFFI